MFDWAQAGRVSWEFSILLRFLLLCLLLLRGNTRTVPFFTLYLAANFAQSVLLAFAYATWGEQSMGVKWVAWTSETLVLFMRALAVAELCRLMLGGYRGIWSLAWRVLAGCAALILVYSAIFSKHQLTWAIISADRGLELAVTTVVVTLFVFLRHYKVVSQVALRTMALGFLLYSFFAVINITLLERLMYPYYRVWNFLGVVTFTATLLIWTWALREAVPRPANDVVLLPGYVYGQLSPEINMRLYTLNERLAQFWRIQRGRS